MKWTDSLIAKAIELHDKHLSYAKIAEKMTKTYHANFTASMVKHKVKRTITGNHDEVPSLKKEVQIHADGSQNATILIRLKHEPNKSPETMMKLCGYDTNQFTLVSSSYKVYEQHSTQDGTIPQYSISVKVRPKTPKDISPEDIVKLFNRKINPIRIDKVAHQNHLNAVIPLADMHFGMTTLDQLRPFLDQQVDFLKRGHKHVVILQLGDLLHSDQFKSSQTVLGTKLDEVDMVKAWQDAKSYYDALITTALKYSDQVSVYSTGGNHSFDLEYTFVDALQYRYPDIDVHNNVDYRTAFALDRVGIMISHGDHALKKLPMLFATEYPDIWSACPYREIYHGHYHEEHVVQLAGVLVREIGTPKMPDPYEYRLGFTTSVHRMQAMEYTTDALHTVTYFNR